MRATNTIAPGAAANNRGKSFSMVINDPANREAIDKSIGDPSRAASFVSTIISVVNTTPKLKECEPSGIISAALRGEIGMGLSVTLGDYAIIPYGTTATFQLQVNGLKRLAIRSGAYSAVNFREVKQGEYIGRDPRTCEPRFQWIEDDDQRETLPTIGYYGFYQLSPEYNNFFQCIYWTRKQCIKHAARFSKAFNLEKFEAMENGKLSIDEINKLRGGSPWYDTEGNGFTKMCMKTIAKQLLGDGLAPKQVMEAIAADNAVEKTGEPVIYADDPFATPTPAAQEPVVEVDETTGEVVSMPENAPQEPAAPAEAPTPAPAQRTGTRRRTAPVPTAPAAAPAVAEAADDFFGDDPQGDFFSE